MAKRRDDARSNVINLWKNIAWETKEHLVDPITEQWQWGLQRFQDADKKYKWFENTVAKGNAAFQWLTSPLAPITKPISQASEAYLNAMWNVGEKIGQKVSDMLTPEHKQALRTAMKPYLEWPHADKVAEKLNNIMSSPYTEAGINALSLLAWWKSLLEWKVNIKWKSITPDLIDTEGGNWGKPNRHANKYGEWFTSKKIDNTPFMWEAADRQRKIYQEGEPAYLRRDPITPEDAAKQYYKRMWTVEWMPEAVDRKIAATKSPWYRMEVPTKTKWWEYERNLSEAIKKYQNSKWYRKPKPDGHDLEYDQQYDATHFWF